MKAWTGIQIVDYDNPDGTQSTTWNNWLNHSCANWSEINGFDETALDAILGDPLSIDPNNAFAVDSQECNAMGTLYCVQM